MIIGISLIIMIVFFISFSMRANKLSINYVMKIFIEIKIVRYFFLKIILGVVIFLILNYNSYVYFGVGLTIYYGVVFIYAFLLVMVVWLVWIINRVFIILSHFLPSGISGLLKIFIPVLEIVGVLIRPLTLAVRLATNISCGHVVSLMFRFFAFNIANYLVVCIRVLLFGLYFIEFLVCIIQAYVFWSLIYIYIIEIEI